MVRADGIAPDASSDRSRRHHDNEVTDSVDYLGISNGGRLCRINVWYYAKAVSDTDPAVMVAAALIQFLCQVKILKHSEDWLAVLNCERLALKASARFLNRHATHTGDPEDALTSQAYQMVVEETVPPQL